MYNKKTGTIVNVQGGGSTSGIRLVRLREVEIAASSRYPSPEEQKSLRRIQIGKDALAIIIHPSNNLTNLSLNDLRDIFAGKVTNWKEVGGPDKKVSVINRESGSGTRSTFEELVMCPQHKDTSNCPEMTLSAIVLNSNSEVKRSVNQIDGSIGYISFGFLDSTVKPVALNGVKPTESEVQNGRYPIFRSLYYLIREDAHNKALKDYLDFVLSPEAQKVLLREGFLPVSQL